MKVTINGVLTNINRFISDTKIAQYLDSLTLGELKDYKFMMEKFLVNGSRLEKFRRYFPGYYVTNMGSCGCYYGSKETIKAIKKEMETK